jgi:hypothetical protein
MENNWYIFWLIYVSFMGILLYIINVRTDGRLKKFIIRSYIIASIVSCVIFYLLLEFLYSFISR